MKQKELLRVIVKGFVDLLQSKMSPAGKALLHDLEAESLLLVDTVPEDAPDIPSISSLNDSSVDAALSWLFSSLMVAKGSERWAVLSVNLLQVIAGEFKSDLIAKLKPATM